MANEEYLTWEAFLNVARASGLDVDDPHMKELYDYLPTILPGLKAVDDLDLYGVDPAMLYVVPDAS